VTIAPDEDAYGNLLRAALEGRDAAEVMERDDGTVWCGDAGRLITDSVDPLRIDDPAIPAGASAGRAGVFGQRLRVRHARFASPWFHYVMTSPDAFGLLVEDSPWQIHRIVDDGSPRYGVVLSKRGR
jgi:hypothetical protein